MIAMLLPAAASAGVVEGNEGMFMGLKGISYVLMGLSFLSAILALGYFIIINDKESSKKEEIEKK